MAVEPSPLISPFAAMSPLTVSEVKVPSDVTLPCAAVWSVPVRSVETDYQCLNYMSMHLSLTSVLDHQLLL